MLRLANYLFLISFILSALNLQVFAEVFYSGLLARVIAYFKIICIIAGIIIYLKYGEKKGLTTIQSLWLIFFIFYFTIGLLSAGLTDRNISILAAIVPFINLFGFFLFFNVKKNITIFKNLTIIIFSISNIFLIYFDSIGFSIDYAGIAEYSLERAGGIYGDANNAALVCLLSIILIKKTYLPFSSIGKIFKLILITNSLIALGLTFSKTGFVIFFLVSPFVFNEIFKVKRILFALIIVPIILLIGIQTALNTPSIEKGQKDRIRDVINIFTLNTSEVKASDRDVLLLNLIDKIEERPFLGYGLEFSAEQHAHNTYFGIWADSGVITFFIFLIIMVYYSITAINALPEIRNIVLPIIIVLGLYMFTLHTVINQNYLMSIFAFLNAILKYKFNSIPD